MSRRVRKFVFPLECLTWHKNRLSFDDPFLGLAGMFVFTAVAHGKAELY